jgi:hypothetical protein
MKKVVSGSIVIIAVVVAMFSCTGGRKESNAKYDSLFLGISLGMESKAFYDHCWEYNRQKVFTHGPSNRNVEYRLVDNINSPVSMRFYPTFYEDKIFEMPVTFTYEAWAPWNRQYHSDSLLVNMLKVFKTWYGPDFKELNHHTMGKVYYRMDGKRRINLFIKDDQFVQAVFTDLKVEKELKKLAEEQSKQAN